MHKTALLIVLTCAATATAQVDHRVNTGNNSTAGQVNDANPQVGSNGLNLTRPGLFDAGLTSNAIVTGNVTGLSGFRGPSPIGQSTAFRESLPSEEFSDFYARSVGANELPNYSLSRPSLFLSKQQTATDAGFARNPYQSPSGFGITNIATPGAFNPNLVTRPISGANPADRRVQGPQAVQSFGMRQQSLSGNQAKGRNRNSTFNNAVTSPIFGIQPPTISSSPYDSSNNANARPLAGSGLYDGLNDFRQNEDDDDDPLSAYETKKTADGLNNPFSINKPKDRGLNNPFAPRPNPRTPARELDIGVNQRDLNTAPPQPGKQSNVPANLGADRFADLFNAVKIAEASGIKQFGFRPAVPQAQPGEGVEAATKEKTEGQQSRLPVGEALVRNSQDGIDQMAANQMWVGDALNDPIKSFAGKFKNDLNRYIDSAEAALRSGQFYKAARQFDMAALIDPRNPLPLLGRGHALVAAGDYSTGLSSILKGIELFPQIAAFKIDLPGIVGNQDVFDRRRADLTTKLESREDAQLRFLLGYLELYSGLSVEGLRDLELAAQHSPADSTIAKFHRLVSGREELPAVTDE